MRYCNICNGELHEINEYGDEECQKCGTIFRLEPMGRTEDESDK